MAIRETFKDDTYARPLNVAHVAKIKVDFRWSLFGRPWVSQRETNLFAVVDGNHRIAAVRELHGDKIEIPVIVLTGLTKADEAYIFGEAQKNRLTISPLQIFRADIEARNEEALAIRQILAERGLEFASSGTRTPIAAKHLRAVTTVRRIFRQGVLKQTLDVLMSAWPNEVEAFGNNQLQGVGAFLQGYPDADTERLVIVLRRRSPVEFERFVKDYGEKLLGGNYRGTAGRVVLVSWYNYKLTTKNQLVSKELPR